MQKGVFLRVGIDKGSDGALAPIFSDASFEFIPISDSKKDTRENRTYLTYKGRHGKPLADYLPNSVKSRVMHFDPEFKTYTYGDYSSKPKGKRLLNHLHPNDILVFYAGLKPFHNNKHDRGCYIIGYFTVKEVIDFNKIGEAERKKYRKKYSNNAHMKRKESLDDVMLVIGKRSNSHILTEAIKISEPMRMKNGKGKKADYLSKKMQKKFGIGKRCIRRSTPFFIKKDWAVKNLKEILGIN